MLRNAQHINEIGRKAWGSLQHESLVSDYDWLLAWEDTQVKQRKICYWWVEDGQTVSQLLDAIESHCRIHRHALVIRAVPGSDPLLRSVVQQRRYLEAPGPPQSVLDIRWHSWREYLRDLKKSHPSTEKSIRMQVNRGRRNGIIIETLDDPSPYLEEIYTILAGHFQRKNHAPYLMAPGYFQVLKDRLGDRAMIHVARKDKRIIGVSIYIKYGAVMHWLGFGIADDHVRSRNSVYFNLAFHFPIEQACQNGTERMVWGTTAYQAKCSRGARLVPVSNWIWQPARLLAALQRLPLLYESWRQKRKLGRFA